MNQKNSKIGPDWHRREFVAAVGGGLVVAGLPLPRTKARPEEPVLICSGAMLFMPTSDGKAIDILVPLAQGADAPRQHADTTPAEPHFAYLAVFDTSDLDPKCIEAYTLLNECIGIKSDAEYSHSLASVAPIKKISYKKSEIRPYNAKYFASTIRLSGGIIKPLRHANSGMWEFSTMLNGDAPKAAQLAHGVRWDPQQPSVEISGMTAGSKIPKTIAFAPNRRFVIGHLPGKPEHWFREKPKPEIGTVDHDFKWLYRIVVPKGETANPDPWPKKLKERVFPAPRCVAAPEFTAQERAQVGSPTCFGGCYGCT